MPDPSVKGTPTAAQFDSLRGAPASVTSNVERPLFQSLTVAIRSGAVLRFFPKQPLTNISC